MVVLTRQSAFGHAPPPATPYSIVSNFGAWSISHQVREGDPEPFKSLVHMYPRFGPLQYAAQLSKAIAKFLGAEGKTAFMYLNPFMWEHSLRVVTSPRRGPFVMKKEDVDLHTVDIGGHRLFVTVYDPEQMPGFAPTWMWSGLGLSIRLSEELLNHVDGMKEVMVTGFDNPPQPTWTPDTHVHQLLRERISDLTHRAPRDAALVTCSPRDVFLYPTGMGAIFYTSKTILEYRPGSVVVLGVIFNNTHLYLQEERHAGIKHFSRTDKSGLDQLEIWLAEEEKGGRPVSYLIAEIPGNPMLDTPDFSRLQKLSMRHGFVLIIDDTVAAIPNVDVLPLCDLVLTSLTKSFSGQSNVMGGSTILNPQSPHYARLSAAWAASYRNELFAGDAQVLLDNSRDLLQRQRILDGNARAMAEYLQSTVGQTDSPVLRVHYPSLLAGSRPNYDACLRAPTSEYPTRGYGCLLSVDFTSVETAAAFYDRCPFYPSPHLGGHVSIMFNYNMFIWGRDPVVREQIRGYGLLEEAVRISAGLEREQDLVDSVKDAWEAARFVYKYGRAKAEEEGWLPNKAQIEATYKQPDAQLG